MLPVIHIRIRPMIPVYKKHKETNANWIFLDSSKLMIARASLCWPGLQWRPHQYMTAYVFTAASYFLSNRRTLYVNFHRRSVDYLEFPLCCSLVLAADGILGSILTLCGHVKFDTQLLSDQGEILHRVLSQFHHSPRSERTMLNPSVV